MAKIVLYCKETPGLKLGPGLPNSANVITFVNGYADVDEDDPLFADKMSWLNGRGCPLIRILGASDVERRPYNPADLTCPVTVPTDEEAPEAIKGHFVRNQVPCGFRAPTEQEISQHMLAVHAPGK